MSGSARAEVSMVGAGFEPAKAEPTGLQPVPFDRSGTPPGTGEFSAGRSRDHDVARVRAQLLGADTGRSPRRDPSARRSSASRSGRPSVIVATGHRPGWRIVPKSADMRASLALKV